MRNTAVRLQGEARRILHHAGISNHPAVLASVIRLVPGKRPRYVKAGQWNYVCEMVNAAYLLGRRVGTLSPEQTR